MACSIQNMVVPYTIPPLSLLEWEQLVVFSGLSFAYPRDISTPNNQHINIYTFVYIYIYSSLHRVQYVNYFISIFPYYELPVQSLKRLKHSYLLSLSRSACGEGLTATASYTTS